MKSIKLNFIYNILLNLSSVIFPLITAPYVARVLEPDGVGLFNFANTYAGYFALFALLGIPIYGVREVSKLRDDKDKLSKFVSEMMSISLITTIGVSIIFLLTIALSNQLHENNIIFILSGIVIYLTPLKIEWYYKGLEEFGFITFRSLVIKTASICCLFLFVHTKSDLMIYIILHVLSIVLADIWNFVKMWNSGIHPYITLNGLKPHFKPLFYLLASSLAISIYTVLDTLMLGFLRDYSEVGYYYNASNISKTFLLIVTSLSTVVIPRFSYYIKNNDMEEANILVNKSISVVLFIAFPLSVGIMCISPVFVPWFLGDQFQGATIPLMILSYLIIAIGLSNIAGIQIIVGMGLDKLFLISILFGSILNFILNCLLIPSIGAVGASIASVSAEFLITSVMLYFVYKYTPIRIKVWNDTINAFIGAILFIPAILLMPNISTSILYIISYTVLCVVLYLITQYVFHNQTLKLCQDSLLSLIYKKFNS